MDNLQEFLWGGAISANQTEGAYLSAGKGLSNFDVLPMNAQRLHDRYTTDAHAYDCVVDEYYPSHTGIHFKEDYVSDIKLLSELGINAFRISISWSRLFPNGDEDEPNAAGLAFYDDLLETFKRYQIEPIITLSHFEVPMALVKNYGGWSDRRVVAYFVHYAEVVMQRYAKQVRYWIPFNEMNMIFHIPFIGGGLVFDPAENKLQRKHQAAHHQLLANAQVIAAGRKINRKFQFGCMQAAGKTYAYTSKPADVLAALIADRENLMLSDVQCLGTYPAYLPAYYQQHDIQITMAPEDLAILKANTVDFVSFSYYSSACTAAEVTGLEKAPTNGFETLRNPYLPKSNSVWQVDATGLRITMNQLYERYQKPLFIVENGLGTADELANGQVHDDYRIDYLRQHLANLQLARAVDGIPTIGYLMWGMLDLVSVSEGTMSKRYGLVYVDADDYGHGSYKRYKKDSFAWFKAAIQQSSAQ